MKKIQMVDLKAQYETLKTEIDNSVLETIQSTAFINGPSVQKFKLNLADYLKAKMVIPCANGTDALQIALMALGLNPGDEVVVPSFTFVATAEVIALLGLKPIMVDCDPGSFNMRLVDFEHKVTSRTKAIIPVHLFGQACDMERIMQFAIKHDIYVIEDNAQAIGCNFTYSSGESIKTGVIGQIGCTSFYPSKNLGAYGDGGAVFTNDEELGNQISYIVNHGMKNRYYHDYIGVNSRLDSLQAAILDIKLQHLDNFTEARKQHASSYDERLRELDILEIPERVSYSDHVFHQYTLKIKDGLRNKLKDFLAEHGIPSMIYYPVPMHLQNAYKAYHTGEPLRNSETLSKEVLSLPMHPDLSIDQIDFICDQIKKFEQY